jgi:O-methyltransferase
MAKILQTIYDVWPHVEETEPRQRERFPEIIEEEFWEVYDLAKPYSMLGVPGFYNLYQSLRYVAANRIQGQLIECGVFLGGACIFTALMRHRLGLQDRTIHAFDTFTGFPEGSVDARRGKRMVGPSLADNYAAVRDNFEKTCGTDRIEFHVGPVEETLPTFSVPPISLIRFDTDHYSSTKIEFEQLYPSLVPGGVLIIDDYGTFDGARRATDEYLAQCRVKPLLNRVDLGVWAGVKPDDGIRGGSHAGILAQRAKAKLRPRAPLPGTVED